MRIQSKMNMMLPFLNVPLGNTINKCLKTCLKKGVDNVKFVYLVIPQNVTGIVIFTVS